MCLCLCGVLLATFVRMLVCAYVMKTRLTEYLFLYHDDRTPQGSDSDTCQSCCWYLSLSHCYASGMYLHMRSDSTALITFQVGWWGTFPLHTIHPFPYIQPTPFPIPLHSCANRKYECPYSMKSRFFFRVFPPFIPSKWTSILPQYPFQRSRHFLWHIQALRNLSDRHLSFFIITDWVWADVWGCAPVIFTAGPYVWTYKSRKYLVTHQVTLTKNISLENLHFKPAVGTGARRWNVIIIMLTEKTLCFQKWIVE